MKLLEPSLQYIDYFIPSLPEAQAIVSLDEPGEVARTLIDDHGVGTVALKMGADGCLVMAAEKDTIRLPAFEVEVVDATGAGDAFAAGFIAGVWHGWSLERTARFASAVGALCVTGVGASGGVRSLAETVDFMETAQVVS